MVVRPPPSTPTLIDDMVIRHVTLRIHDLVRQRVLLQETLEMLVILFFDLVLLQEKVVMLMIWFFNLTILKEMDMGIMHIQVLKATILWEMNWCVCELVGLLLTSRGLQFI